MEYTKNITNTFVLRKSCRKYISKPMPKSDIELILWAGERSAYCSGGPRRIVDVITTQEDQDEIQAACMNQKCVGECSAVFVISGTKPDDKLRSGFAKFAPDCYMACCQMHLMATSLDYGSLIVGNFIPDRIKEIIGTEHRPTIILLVGYKA